MKVARELRMIAVDERVRVCACVPKACCRVLSVSNGYVNAAWELRVMAADGYGCPVGVLRVQ